MEPETETEFETEESPQYVGNPKKLEDDSWGAWIDGQPQVGDTVTIRTRSGKEWEAEIVEIVEQFSDHMIARTRGIN